MCAFIDILQNTRPKAIAPSLLFGTIFAHRKDCLLHNIQNVFNHPPAKIQKFFDTQHLQEKKYLSDDWFGIKKNCTFVVSYHIAFLSCQREKFFRHQRNNNLYVYKTLNYV